MPSVFQVEMERVERVKLEHLVKTGSLPDDAKMGLTNDLAALNSSKIAAARLNSKIPALNAAPGIVTAPCNMYSSLLAL